jgi:hypothetical protein
MKKIYDYHTGKLLNESDSQQNKLNESYTINDILEDGRIELHNDVELRKRVLSPSDKPIVIWEFRGTRTAEDVVEIFEGANIEYDFVTGRELATLDDSISGTGAEYLIIDDFTYGQVNDVVDLIELVSSLNINVVLIGKCDSAVAEQLPGNTLSLVANYVYTPTYDRAVANVEDDEFAYESVTEKFAKYRKLYESDETNEEDKEDKVNEDDTDSDDNSSDDDKKDDNSSDDDKKDDDSSSDDNSDDTSSDETEDVPMTAILLTVGKDDADACKDELVDAGIPEDGIEIIDSEEDDENKKIRVDADYAFELKDYLKGKGIDLEEKIGGEIVDDSAEDSSDDDKDSDDDTTSDDDKDSNELSFDDEFGDLFADDEASADEQK